MTVSYLQLYLVLKLRKQYNFQHDCSFTNIKLTELDVTYAQNASRRA